MSSLWLPFSLKWSKFKALCYKKRIIYVVIPNWPLTGHIVCRMWNDATKILSGCSWFFFGILRCFLFLVLKQSKSYRTGTFRSKIGHTSKILSIFGESPRSLVRTEHHAVILEDVSNYTTNLALTNHIQLFLPVITRYSYLWSPLSDKSVLYFNKLIPWAS